MTIPSKRAVLFTDAQIIAVDAALTKEIRSISNRLVAMERDVCSPLGESLERIMTALIKAKEALRNEG